MKSHYSKHRQSDIDFYSKTNSSHTNIITGYALPFPPFKSVFISNKLLAEYSKQLTGFQIICRKFINCKRGRFKPPNELLNIKERRLNSFFNYTNKVVSSVCR